MDEVGLGVAVGLAVINVLGGKRAFQRCVVGGHLWVCPKGITKFELLMPARGVKGHDVNVGAAPSIDDFDEESPPGSTIEFGSDVVPVVRGQRC